MGKGGGDKIGSVGKKECISDTVIGGGGVKISWLSSEPRNIYPE